MTKTFLADERGFLTLKSEGLLRVAESPFLMAFPSTFVFSIEVQKLEIFYWVE